MSKDIDAQVDAILQEAGVAYAAAYSGEAALGETKWRCDRWRVKLGGYETDYHTGFGHRKAGKGLNGLRRKNPYPPSTVGWRNWQERYVKPRVPPVAGVLYSVILDADAANSNFNDWCSDSGYSKDSIAALNIYKVCCDTAEALRKVFKPEALARLREILQDY